VRGFVGSDRTLKRLRRIAVSEVMVAANGAAGGPTVRPHDDLRRVATLFLEHDVQFIACVDDGGHVIGRVTRDAVARRLGD
jgi:CBS domain-containing protein